MVGLFCAGFIVRAVTPEAIDARPFSTSVLLHLGAFVSAIAAAWLLGRYRSDSQDPTNWMDALALTGGVAALAWGVLVWPAISSDLSVPEISEICTFVVLDIILFAAISRLAVGPGVRNTSYYLMVAYVAVVLISDVFSSLAIVYPDLAERYTAFVLLFVPIGFAAAAASSLHPSMGLLAHSGTAPIGRMSWGRLVLMTLSIFVPPCVFFTRPEAQAIETLGLAVIWALVTGLVMVRFAGLARAYERDADGERLLSEAAVALVSATNLASTYRAALDGALSLGRRPGTDGCAAVVLERDGMWTIEASSTESGVLPVGAVVQAQRMEALVEPLMSEARILSRTTLLGMLASARGCDTVVAPISSVDGIRGVLVLELSVRPSEAAIVRVGRLATDVSLALEAKSLAEDLLRRESERRFRSLVQHSNDVVAVIDDQGRINYISPSCQAVLGFSDERLLHQSFLSMVHLQDRSALQGLVSMLDPSTPSPKKTEVRVVAADGSTRTVDVTVTDLRRERSVAGIVINLRDVTDRKALEEDLRHKVLHDDLTGIANRVLLRERVQHALAGRQRSGGVVAALFIDLDDFKTLNDALGHDAGDELLKVIAFRLSQFVRDGDTAARLGGDEFAVLLEDAVSEEYALAVADRLIAAIALPIVFGGRDIVVDASVGLALADEDATADVILRNADVAMYHAKRTGKGRVCVFDEAMYSSAFERMEMKADLAGALEKDELQLYYQPIFSLEDDSLLGFEALMRWVHPQRGFISPAAFIPLAEETALIVPMGAWALRVALDQLKEWSNDFPGLELTMNVNVSPRQLERDEIVDEVKQCLASSGVEPSRVVLELTESAVVDDDVSRYRLERLRDTGVGIAADDFGTGFASYAALAQLPFTIVKIDRSLIMGLTDAASSPAHAQVKSIIDMAHATGLVVVAEGIEEAAQRDALASMGCDKAQGFLYGKPSAAGNAREVVRASALISSRPISSGSFG